MGHIRLNQFHFRHFHHRIPDKDMWACFIRKIHISHQRFQ